MSATTLPVAGPASVRREARMLLREHRRGLGAVLTLHALAALVGLAGPAVLGRLVDGVRAGAGTGDVDALIGVLVVAIVVQTLLTWAARRQSFVLGEHVFALLREQFMRRVTALPLSTVERAGTGDLVTRTTRDVDALSHTVRFAVPTLLVAGITTLLTLAAAFVTAPLVALPIVAGLPLLWASWTDTSVSPQSP